MAIREALILYQQDPYVIDSIEGLVIFSDSKSAIEAIRNGETNISCDIITLLEQLHCKRKSCILQWIPAHVNIEGNECAVIVSLKKLETSIDFEKLEELGRGGFATVYKARCLKRGIGELVAIKEINKKDENWRKHKKFVCKEIEIHSTLQHRNIVKLYDTFEDEDYIYLILELCEEGSLEDYMKRQDHPFSESIACCIFKQIIDGVMYLHDKFVIHRDLSLKNILLTKNMQARHCCRVSAADKGCRVYPLDPRPDAVALCSGCTPGKRHAWFCQMTGTLPPLLVSVVDGGTPG
ncbi:hypothetical protein TNCV_2952001 [Trichonephila clavipes]|nr:hypothetical protein TNCV_2952001 [Trichonephila clavipes]